MLTHYNRSKVGIKLLKISYVRILFLVSLLFIAVINPYSVFLNFQFLNILILYVLRSETTMILFTYIYTIVLYIAQLQAAMKRHMYTMYHTTSVLCYYKSSEVKINLLFCFNNKPLIKQNRFDNNDNTHLLVSYLWAEP